MMVICMTTYGPITLAQSTASQSEDMWGEAVLDKPVSANWLTQIHKWAQPRSDGGGIDQKDRLASL